jgi:outer membrane murein-binding lipoprotein Lpp
MKPTLIALACVALIAGCAKQDDQKLAALQAQVKTLEESRDQTEQRNETLQEQVTDLDGKLRDAKAEADGLRLKLEDGRAANDEEKDKLAERIVQLEAEIERLKQDPRPEVAPEPTTEKPEPKKEPKPDPEVVKRLDELLPMIKAADSTSMETAYELIANSDKQTRDDFIARIEQWVKDDPENKLAHMALATVLVARFPDIKDPMKQGALAGQIKKETERALEIDPEYYDAVHFLAILKVNYPTFTSEFKDAPTSLDKALTMQENLTWEDRFADIYAAYGKWYRMQDKYDDGLAWVQKGLDKAPRHQGLVDEQKRLEDAKANPED